jgi:hypothetical protein
MPTSSAAPPSCSAGRSSRGRATPSWSTRPARSGSPTLSPWALRRNIVRSVTSRQLPQVVQGAHPGAAGLSCLDWLLGENAAVPPDRGNLLPTTRRMHAELCRFVSEQVEGRLASHPDCARQRVGGTGLPKAGAHLVGGMPRSRARRSTRSGLPSRNSAPGSGPTGTAGTRRLHESDIIVAAPYKASRRAPRRFAPAGSRRRGRQVPEPVGTRLRRLDNRPLDRGRAAGHGMPVLAQPHQRRGLPRQGAGAGLRVAPLPGRGFRHRREGAPRRRPLRCPSRSRPPVAETPHDPLPPHRRSASRQALRPLPREGARPAARGAARQQRPTRRRCAPHGAPGILVAGDSFDSPTSSPATLRQAPHAMAADPRIR